MRAFKNKLSQQNNLEKSIGSKPKHKSSLSISSSLWWSNIHEDLTFDKSSSLKRFRGPPPPRLSRLYCSR